MTADAKDIMYIGLHMNLSRSALISLQVMMDSLAPSQLITFMRVEAWTWIRRTLNLKEQSPISWSTLMHMALIMANLISTFSMLRS